MRDSSCRCLGTRCSARPPPLPSGRHTTRRTSAMPRAVHLAEPSSSVPSPCQPLGASPSATLCSAVPASLDSDYWTSCGQKQRWSPGREALSQTFSAVCNSLYRLAGSLDTTARVKRGILGGSKKTNPTLGSSVWPGAQDGVTAPSAGLLSTNQWLTSSLFL